MCSTALPSVPTCCWQAKTQALECCLQGAIIIQLYFINAAASTHTPGRVAREQTLYFNFLFAGGNELPGLQRDRGRPSWEVDAGEYWTSMFETGLRPALIGTGGLGLQRGAVQL